jgi:hypothetical protein
MYYQGEELARLERVSIDAAVRLRFAFSVVRERPLGSEAWAWFGARLQEESTHWAARVSHPGSVVGLMSHLKDAGYEISNEVLASVRTGLERANYSYAWSELERFRRFAPEAFSPEILRSLQAKCEQWVTSSIEKPEYLSDSEELDAIVSAARQWGIEPDEELLQIARDVVSERSSVEFREDVEVPTPRASREATAAELGEMDALFTRLAQAE